MPLMSRQVTEAVVCVKLQHSGQAYLDVISNSLVGIFYFLQEQSLGMSRNECKDLVHIPQLMFWLHIHRQYVERAD